MSGLSPIRKLHLSNHNLVVESPLPRTARWRFSDAKPRCQPDVVVGNISLIRHCSKPNFDRA